MTKAHTLRPLRTLARTSELHKPEGVAAFVFCADGVLGLCGRGAGAMAVEAGNGDPETWWCLPCRHFTLDLLQSG